VKNFRRLDRVALWLSSTASADFCGVVGPVACRETLPVDGDVGVDAQGAGEDRGGDLGGELEERGAAGLVGADPELVQPLRQLCGADRSSGLTFGEELWRRGQGSDRRVALAVRGDATGQRGDGPGQLDGVNYDLQLESTPGPPARPRIAHPENKCSAPVLRKGHFGQCRVDLVAGWAAPSPADGREVDRPGP
jgi:hypothetical protein